MPELPEVETIRCGIEPHIINQKIGDVIIRERRLRLPITDDIFSIKNKVITKVDRRGKYLLLHAISDKSKDGYLLIHLGMSGRIYILNQNQLPQKHDHLDIVFEHDKLLRFSDPRRFGLVQWNADILVKNHPLLKELGPEPLDNYFDETWFFAKIKNSNRAIKLLLMDNKIVVGVGNIYANEALFHAGVSPYRLGKNISFKETQNLVHAVRHVLQMAIHQGGTTLKDFVNAEGKPGYFQQELYVYGREGKKCRHCQNILLSERLVNRATFYCETCQK